ncbi:hypothetical protein ACLOJK_017740 [Asimina triloba]
MVVVREAVGIMGSLNIKDLLTSFSPSLDFLAITSGDGRVKIWDTLKGQIQTEFADIASTEGTDLSMKSDSGHLSLDYTCMKWIHFGQKKKKPRHSVLVLGTGSGDVLALDIAAGQLRWKLNDCHPGGVRAISSSKKGSCIYTGGADGMVCEIDLNAGNLLGKFQASTKAVSALSVSSDGKILATAAAQLKIFDCSDNKKIQKFSGHPATVRCMVFTEDGKYILSSAVGERFVALWEIDGGKKQSASCVLSMDNPAVFLDSKGVINGSMDDEGLSVLAISESGICYFWHGKNVEELRSVKPTKISLSPEESLSKNQKGSKPTIIAASIHGISKQASGQLFVAYGSLVKPSFVKLGVQHGVDVSLNSSQDGILLPNDRLLKPSKGQTFKTEVTALDRANAEDAVIPMAKLHDFHDKKRKHRNMQSTLDLEELMAEDVLRKSESGLLSTRVNEVHIEEDATTVCMEDRLRSLGIISTNEDIGKESQSQISHNIVSKLAMPNDFDPFTEANIPAKKMTKSKHATIQPLLQLSGRLQLIMAQVNKAGQSAGFSLPNDLQADASDDEDGSEDFDEVIYREEDDTSNGGSEIDK